MTDKAQEKRSGYVATSRSRAQAIRESTRDRRRYKDNAISDGVTRARVSADAVGTLFPKTVKQWRFGNKERIFKDGAWNAKIGGNVSVGDLKGAYIYTLSLEERATCPRSCNHWTTCYGNAMHRAVRWEYDAYLRMGMADEIRELCLRHDTVLIRLHVLGDFPDARAVQFWEDQLRLWPNLHCFGFTAHKPDTSVGRKIVQLRRKYKQDRKVRRSRFAIRHSGTSGMWGSITLDYPTVRKRLGDGIVCPEQIDADIHPDKQTHCGSCAVCWQTPMMVAFREH